MTISQNSMGNDITELLGIVVKRVADEKAYAKADAKLVTRLLELRYRLVVNDPDEPISTKT